MAAARRLVIKRMPASRGKPMPARARQLMGMLARKGYSAGLATQVVREALEQEEEDDAGAREDLALICEDSAPVTTGRERGTLRGVTEASLCRACPNCYQRLTSRQRGVSP